MRIIYMGTPDFAIPSLQVLLDHPYEIAAVVTVPDKPRGRGQQVLSSPIKDYALQHQLPLLQPQDLKAPDFVAAVSSLKPDLIVVVAFRILPKEVFLIPRLGALNLHASLLPKYRGAAPINWAIINGEKETGVTTFLLQEKVDTGAIVLQARVKIGPDETAGELHDKLAEVGAEIVLQTVRLIELGKAQPRLQENEQASAAPKIFREDCKIDWKSPDLKIHNFVRGLSPHPCAWTTHEGTVLRIYRTELRDTKPSQSSTPGSVVEATKKSLSVATGSNMISVVEIQQEGRKRMMVEDFLRGYTLGVGEMFT
jgi:methionyl-tRNA formyltransferase